MNERNGEGEQAWPHEPVLLREVVELLGDRARVLEVATGRVLADEGFTFPEPIVVAGSSFTSVREDLKVMTVRTVTGEWQAWWLGRGRVEKVVPMKFAPVSSDAGGDGAFGYVSFSPTQDQIGRAHV